MIGGRIDAPLFFLKSRFSNCAVAARACGPIYRPLLIISRSWSLVKMGTTARHRKLFFNLRKAKSRISVLDEGDMRPDQVKLIAKRLGVTERAVIDMNRRLGGDASINDTICEGRDSARNGRICSWVNPRTKRRCSQPARNSMTAAVRYLLCLAH
jgi:DNA-directed RNA polymerase sigma subunit (sigma70/sigma32)